MTHFKKLSIATAVSVALGLHYPAHAITQGEPGDALLVPYVLVDSANSINTQQRFCSQCTISLPLHPTG